MKNLFSKKAFVAFAAGAMLLSSCHDNDIYDPSDIVKDYADNWQKTFGDIDPNQDWNVATSVTANAALNIPGSSTMKIYTANPLSSDSRLLAITELNNGVGSISFDAIKGSTSLFVTIHKDNKYIIYDNYIVENGQVNINASSSAKVATRSVFTDTWNGVHTGDADKFVFYTDDDGKHPFSDNWMSKLGFSKPANTVTVTSNTQIKTGSVYYVPEDYTGTINFDNFNGDLYVAGTVTGFDGNPGTLNLYILKSGVWKKGFTTGSITIYNDGDLVFGGYDLQNNNVQAIYNGGSFKLGDKNSGVNTSNSVKLYSIGTVEIEGTGTIDYKFPSDIHGMLNVTGNIKIQNSTAKYICGIIATGTIENVDGPLITSYVKSNVFSFDGNPIYLLSGGHIDVTTLKIPNSGCHVYGQTGSNGLVEATNFEFGNKNDFTHTFSNNIYFKTHGGYVKIDNCYAMGSSHNFGSIDEYLAYTGHNENQSDEYLLAADRINKGNVTGSAACGDTWSTDGTIPTPSEIEVKDTPGSWIIACEDLGSKDDIDFNDVVFSVEYVAGTTTATVTPLAAGGIYSAEIGYIEDDSFVHEVHSWFGRPGENGSQKMLNTGVDSGANEDGVTATSKTVTVPQNFKLSYNKANQTNMGGFYIKVSSTTNATTILGSGVGEAPQMILVPGTWKWPKERIKIYDAYPDFENWSKNSTNSSWYNNPTTETSLLYTNGSDNDNNSSTGSDVVSLNEYIQSGYVSIPASIFEPYKETGATITITTDGYVKIYAWENDNTWNAYIDNAELNNETRQFTISRSDIQKIIGVGKMLITFNYDENHVKEFTIQAAK